MAGPIRKALRHKSHNRQSSNQTCHKPRCRTHHNLGRNQARTCHPQTPFKQPVHCPRRPFQIPMPQFPMPRRLPPNRHQPACFRPARLQQLAWLVLPRRVAPWLASTTAKSWCHNKVLQYPAATFGCKCNKHRVDLSWHFCRQHSIHQPLHPAHNT